ncbi:MAG TPA: glycoside hydrolase family 3 C-terminal domain-containing protein [Blastocatellia bacterium]|nr:glycoside hydrolase family 3 C-terminal domain-containing protein [Blastocatellia bacterium]
MQRLCCIILVVLIGAVPALTQSSNPPSTAETDRRVESILSQMTLEEKIDLIGGVDGFFVRGVQRLKVPRLKMADGPIGVRNYGPATAMAAGIGLSATWNPALAERVGSEIGRDARAKGVHFLLGPGVNIYRAPMNGRNFEYYGEDPFLASRTAVGYVKGVQSQGVSATIKHFMGNNSEFDRHGTDSVIDERAMREIYLPVFEAAVKEAHVGAIMDSYNLTNGEHMSQNKYLNTEVAKKEWGFDGVIMSDWGGTYDAVGAANGGLDLEMPSGQFMNRKNLLPAIEQNKVSVATIDDKVRRILRTATRFGWLDNEQTSLTIPRYNREGRRIALEAAREGMVLLKNDGAVLPFDKSRIKSIAIIGPNAYPAVPVGGGSARVQPFNAVSFLEGVSQALGDTANVYHHRGVPTLNDLAESTNFSTAETNGQPGLKVETFSSADLSGTPLANRVDRHINVGGGGGFGGGGFGGGGGAPAPPQGNSTRWTGYYTAETAGDYDLFVQNQGERSGVRLYIDDKPVIDSWNLAAALVRQTTLSLNPGPHKIVMEQFRGRGFGPPRVRLGITKRGTFVEQDAKLIAAKADAVVIAAGFEPETETEGGDRGFQLLPGQDELIREIVAANRNTVVVITSGGSVDMASWVDRVPAIIEAWYPGQEGGTALADILLGDVNPSGRLPITFERRGEDNPVHGSYYPEPGSKRIVYKESVFVGYRGYEKNGTKPLFPFGYGLSYTTFQYGKLSIGPCGGESNGNGSGPCYEVSFDLKNTGNREGAEVAQVYVGDTHAKTPRPAKELKGFTKVSLRPGETKRASVMLNERAFAYYDVAAKQWRVDPGEFSILVGRSSEQIELRGKLVLPPGTGGR